MNKKEEQPLIERFSRMEYLKLPKVDFYQLRINYQAIEAEEKINTAQKLQTLFDNLDDNFKTTAVNITTTLQNLDKGQIEILTKKGL